MRSIYASRIDLSPDVTDGDIIASDRHFPSPVQNSELDAWEYLNADSQCVGEVKPNISSPRRADLVREPRWSTACLFRFATPSDADAAMQLVGIELARSPLSYRCDYGNQRTVNIYHGINTVAIQLAVRRPATCRSCETFAGLG